MTETTTRPRGFSTQQVHAGTDEPTSGGVNPRALPIHATAGFVFDDFDQAADRFGEVGGYSYTRVGNPTSSSVERRLAVLEGGADALLLASGQAAVTATLLGLLGAGDHVLVNKLAYRFGEPRRRDLVVLRSASGGLLLKRVVGVGGDDVGVEDGVLVVNGRAVRELGIVMGQQ